MSSNEERKRNLRTQGRFAGGGAALKTVRTAAPGRRSEGSARPNSNQSQTNNFPSSSKSSNLQNSSCTLTYQKTESTEVTFKRKNPECRVLSSDEYNQWIPLDIEANPISEIYYNPEALSTLEADDYFGRFAYGNIIKWEEIQFVTSQGDIVVPRLVCWYGPFSYTYSKMHHEANMDWPDEITELKTRVETLLRLEGRPVNFNSVLLNFYRNCHDGVAWHSDNELSMGVNPTIASISLGETRKFELKRQEDPEETAEWRIHLTSGSLLVMDSNVQVDWKHRVPKEYHDRKPRVNLTFRTVYETENPKKNERRTI